MLIVETKDNNYTVSIDGITLHSKYSPIKEAKKFIETNIKTDGTLIIIGAGLGYIYTAITQLYPKISVIGIPLNKTLGEKSLIINKTNRIQWDFTNLTKFLKTEISVKNIKGLQVLEWEPTAKVYKEFSTEVNNSLVTIIRRINGNLLTTARFGRIWIKNSIKNYLKIENYVTDFKINKPIVIVASGKSLNNYFDFLREIREQVVIISLSSANMALESNNITPDLTFSTDPGYYSKLHLYGNKNILAMPLTNSTSVGNTVLLLNQGNKFENQIIGLESLPHINIRENGTVAGTALEFAIKYSNKEIYLFGQDLESRSMETHVSPYSFDKLLINQQNRNNPHYSIMYKRWIDQGVSFKTYRDWFSNISINNPDRIFRINMDSKNIPGIHDIDTSCLRLKLNNNINKGITFTTKTLNSRDNRINNIEKLLNNWLKRLNQEIIKENTLFYLISTSKYTDVNNKALSDDLKNIKFQECKEESIQFIKRLLSLYGRKLL